MRARGSTAGAAILALVAALAAVVVALRAGRSGGGLPGDGDTAETHAAGEPSVVVTSIELGRSVGLDKRIAEPAEAFAPQDTIYVSVTTEGRASHARLTARWLRDGALLAETSQTIAPDGTAVSEFNVWKPQGWPPGEYQVEILADGFPAGTRAFQVR